MTATRHEQLAAEIGLEESVSIVSVDEFGVEHEMLIEGQKRTLADSWSPPWAHGDSLDKYRQPSLSERSPDELGEWSTTIQSLRNERDAWRIRAERAEKTLAKLRQFFEDEL